MKGRFAAGGVVTGVALAVTLALVLPGRPGRVAAADRAGIRGEWTVSALTSQGELPVYRGHNILLTEGKKVALGWLTGDTTTYLPFDSAHSYLGISTVRDTPVAGDSGLYGDTIWYEPVDAGWPVVVESLGYAEWRATVADGDAQFAWAALTVANDSTDSTGQNLSLMLLDTAIVKAAGQAFRLTYRLYLY